MIDGCDFCQLEIDPFFRICQDGSTRLNGCGSNWRRSVFQIVVCCSYNCSCGGCCKENREFLLAWEGWIEALQKLNPIYQIWGSRSREYTWKVVRAGALRDWRRSGLRANMFLVLFDSWMDGRWDEVKTSRCQNSKGEGFVMRDGGLWKGCFMSSYWRKNTGFALWSNSGSSSPWKVEIWYNVFVRLIPP